VSAPELALDDRFGENGGRVVHRESLTRLLSERTVRFASADLLARLSERQVPAGPINTIPEVFDHPQVLARGLRIDPLRAGAAAGLRSPIVIDGAPMVADRAPPRLGEHDAQIRADRAWRDD
jgi:crotonobetainyl-CoA:carnitine CoA-transferase CaiB-like acyl-CoA transferase